MISKISSSSKLYGFKIVLLVSLPLAFSHPYCLLSSKLTHPVHHSVSRQGTNS